MRARKPKYKGLRFRRGRWELDFKNALGRRVQEAQKDLRVNDSRSEAEAAARLFKRLEEVKAGKYQAPSERVTIAELTTLYLEQHCAPKVRASTLEDYRQIARDHLTPHVGRFMARELKASHVEAMRAAVAATPSRDVGFRNPAANAKTPAPRVSARTVNKALGLLSSICRYGVRHDHMTKNPCDGISRLRQANAANAMHVLDFGEVSRLLEKCEKRWRLGIEFAVFTGCRQGELLGLSWSDFDWEKRRVFVRRAFKDGAFHDPKTETSVRFIEFPARLVRPLKEWKLACPKGSHDLTFPNTTGGPESASNLLTRGFFPALRRAGLPKIRFHDLRHTYASLSLANGENIAVVSRQLGHRNTIVTQTIYRHLLPGEGAGLTDRLAERVFGGKSVAATPGGETTAA